MRRRLIVVFLAVSSLVAISFVAPLAIQVQRTAEDRAIDSARADAAAIVPVLVANGTRDQIEAAAAVTGAWQDDRVTILTWQGWTVGADIEPSARLSAALSNGQSAIGDTDGGAEVVSAVATGPDQLSAVRVFVPDHMLRRGVWRAWGLLALTGAVLITISVGVADRLARSVVQPTQRLAQAARRLGDGDLDAKVDPEGPAELVDLGAAFNTLGSQVSSMLVRERELVAELSHRTRTPLTKLRLRVDQVNDPELASTLRADIDEVTAVVNELIEEARGAISAVDGCDFVRVVTERANYWQVLAEDQGRAWEFTGRGPARRVPVSEADLAAAVDVLIENIFAHTPEGTAMFVRFASDAAFASLVVGDAGPGIEPASVRRGESGAGSTGLGLDIVRGLAARASGSFTIGTSHLGGSEIELRLPVLGTAKQ